MGPSGSSPLTRGKPVGVRCDAVDGRLIPAHAGKTGGETPPRLPGPAHPRSRGENIRQLIHLLSCHGSSPLTRGKLRVRALGVRRRGLIPAHAGKTQMVGFNDAQREAHPRSRGENQSGLRSSRSGRGSSPLTRGKQPLERQARVDARLIPAHAGKTLRMMPRLSGVPAHPRSRGENIPDHWQGQRDLGSSPLTRGKRRRSRLRHARRGLIPAHAGKTKTRPSTRRTPTAHPRSRGENGDHHASRVAARLIPAHAGKTR